MNFRSCKYFLTVCEMGTINAAARKLYISQQSLSQHIRRMEEEVGAQLFHRDNPLALTKEGECVKRAAQTVLSAMEQMDREIAECKGTVPRQLVIGLLDYGTPEFLPSLIDLFLKKDPDITLQTRELMPGEQMPRDIPLFISAKELGVGYKSEVIITDRLGVSVSDELLKRVYGDRWREHRDRLKNGELSALEGCPFIQHRNTPLQYFQDMAFRNNDFTPNYLRVMGSVSALARMCANGQGAMVTMMGHARQEQGVPMCYPVSNVPDRIPTAFICYRSNEVLSAPAQQFLEITRRYFRRSREKVM